MKIKIRQGVFETNSSSTHSLVICTADEYAAFKNGDLMLDVYADRLVPADKEELFYNKYVFRTFDNWAAADWIEQTFFNEFETPSGDKMVCFGAFGRT